MIGPLVGIGSARRWLVPATLLLGAGCGSLSVDGPPPEVLEATVAANPNNVLSLIVTSRVAAAESVAVRYGPASGPIDQLSAAVSVEANPIEIPVLGLDPETRYRLQVVAFGLNSTAQGSILESVTEALPDDLPRYHASGADPTPGYVIFAAGRYGLAIDNSGRVAWYHRFPDGAGLNFMAQVNGRYVARPGTADPSDGDPWIEIDVLGRATRTLGCARGLVARLHDLITMPDGSYWLMCDEVKVRNLAAVGGAADALVMGTVVQRVGSSGALMAEWSPFDHLDVTEVDPTLLSASPVNWTHGNAIDLGADGNLVISYRNLSEILKVDPRTGAVIWRLGGSRNQFRMENSATPPFSRQHGLRLTGPNQLLLLDNLGEVTGSRAERYEVDPGLGTARLLGFYRPGSAVTAQLGGTTQQLSNGHTLVSFGTAGRVEEYDAAGTMVWQIEGNPGYVFRAQRVRSLYHPGVEGR